MKAVGLFGGTFDPIHIGHLITAQAVKEIRNLEKIIFIPAYISPHKTDKKHSESFQRLEMLKLAIKDKRYFDYSDYEILKKDISYTFETLKELKKKYNSIELIIGYDNLVVFDTWKNPEEILTLAKLIVLGREIKKPGTPNKFFKSAEFVKTPVLEISATQLRERVRRDLPIDFFVPENVKEYIYKNNLYKEK